MNFCNRFLVPFEFNDACMPFMPYKLVYCKSLLYGITTSSHGQLTAHPECWADLVALSIKYENITPALLNLHWLPINYRIVSRNQLTPFKTLNNRAPSHICDLVLHTLSRYSTLYLIIPPCNRKTYTTRSFPVLAPMLWNALPSDIKNSSSMSTF